MRAIILLFALIFISGCQSGNGDAVKIIFLHHSTGLAIWRGNTNRYIYKITQKGDVEKYISKYNKEYNTRYKISKQAYPLTGGNFPFDYYNLWVKNAGLNSDAENPGLEELSELYDVIIFKHCYPVGNILEDTGSPDIDSDEKRIENYKLQYQALKKKMHEFNENIFIVWTPAAMVRNRTSEEHALRAKSFYQWMKGEWDEQGDNIFLWDFYNLETEGELYFKDEYAVSADDSHPNPEFSGIVAPVFGQFIIDCIERE